MVCSAVVFAAPRRPCRILLTGASGRVGSMLRRAWSARDDLAVFPVTRRGIGPDWITWHPGDPLDGLPRVDCVAALWGVTRGDAAALSGNAALAETAMALGRSLGARRVLHASSAAVYGPTPACSAAEDTPLRPAGAYGAAKRDMEARIALLRSASPDGPEPLCLRIGNVAGADSLFASLRRDDGPVTLDRFADGAGPERSYIAPPDLADAIRALAVAETATGVVNVAAPAPTAMAALVRAAGRAVTWQDAPEQAIRRVALRTERLARYLALPPAAGGADYLVRSARAAAT